MKTSDSIFLDERTPKEKREEIESSVSKGEIVTGILETLPDGYGFIRNSNYLASRDDVYVSQTQIHRFNLKTGDFITGYIRQPKATEKYKALMYTTLINGEDPSAARSRQNFEKLTPIFPDKRLKLDQANNSISMRIIDLLSPIGKGQRGIIVSPPKAGKTTLLKNIALSIHESYPDMHLLILLIVSMSSGSHSM